MQSHKNLLLACLIALASGASNAANYFVSLSGKDTNAGDTITSPFRTIAMGVSVLQPGDTLYLRKGVYVEKVDIAQKGLEIGPPIVIRSYTGEHAYIDGTLEQFRKRNSAGVIPDWEPARLYDPQAHAEEFVSVQTFGASRVNQGAFLDRNPHTRLITYSNLNDLRAANQTFAAIPLNELSDNATEAFDQCKVGDTDPACAFINAQGERFKSLGYGRPWVYMGPGIWFNDIAGSPTAGRVHVRLSHTTNNIVGLADYTGEIDPRLVPLAIAPKDFTTLTIRGTANFRLENVSVRYGGEYTVELLGSRQITFDHVRVFASSYGMRMGGTQGNKATAIMHTEFDGGVPTWYFRTDRKSEYYFLNNGTIDINNLGKQTTRALLLPSSKDDATEIAYSEFRNGHDVYARGSNVQFHHNWVNNLNDEGLVMDFGNNPNMRVFQNVFTKVLSPISFAAEKTEDVGQKYIYRNLVDLRGRIAGRRPQFAGDTDVWRYGNTFKSNGEDPPWDIFQNTFLVYDQNHEYLHFANKRDHRRRSLNNAFVAVNPSAESDKAITFLPTPCMTDSLSDGNNYFRIGLQTKNAYRYVVYSPCLGKVVSDAGSFATLADLRASPFFRQSQIQYAPGHEGSSIESDPMFRRIGADGGYRETDDLRLSDISPAIRAGVLLPDDLRILDPHTAGLVRPDIGAFPNGGAPLQVGVNGSRSFPNVAP